MLEARKVTLIDTVSEMLAAGRVDKKWESSMSCGTGGLIRKRMNFQ